MMANTGHPGISANPHRSSDIIMGIAVEIQSATSGPAIGSFRGAGRSLTELNVSYATAVLGEPDALLFLLPGGRPGRLRASRADIQAGGRPRRRPRPRASLSRLRIASSICSRSWRSSASILVTSMASPSMGRCLVCSCSESGTIDNSRVPLGMFYPRAAINSTIICSEIRTWSHSNGTKTLEYALRNRQG